MPLEYRKLAHVTEDMQAGILTAADVAQLMTDGLVIVNLKGRILTAMQVAAHLSGTLDGETVER